MKNRRKGQQMEQHLFECPICNSRYSLFRPKGNLREQNHKKWIYCYQCKRKRNFTELGQY